MTDGVMRCHSRKVTWLNNTALAAVQQCTPSGEKRELVGIHRIFLGYSNARPSRSHRSIIISKSRRNGRGSLRVTKHSPCVAHCWVSLKLVPVHHIN